MEIPAETLIRSTAHRPVAETWSLVLEALGVPHRLTAIEASWGLVVAAADAARATAALEAHDRELAEPATDVPVPDHGPSRAAWLVPASLVAFFFVTGERGWPDPTGWFREGSAVAERIIAGQWWRAVTALTLHADLAHVLGNAVALVIFLSALCRWLGHGLALCLVLLAGVLGNGATALFYEAGHRSVGASTSAFGAIGLLGGLQFVRHFRITARIDRRRRALAALGACLALFAMLGVGERADVAAHLFGLGAGLGLGLVTALAVRRPAPRFAQWLLTAASAAAVGGAWLAALG